MSEQHLTDWLVASNWLMDSNLTQALSPQVGFDAPLAKLRNQVGTIDCPVENNHECLPAMAVHP